MERIALEYEQLQEKSIHHDFLTSKNLKRTPSSHSMAAGLLSPSVAALRTVSPSSPPPLSNTATSTAGGAAQRQRRNASHNKLPL
jgi:hypothetical protein